MRIIFFITCFIAFECYALEPGSISPQSARRNMLSRLGQIKNSRVWEDYKDEMFKYIEKSSVPIDSQTGNNSMLSLAVEFNDITMAKKLLERGARTDTKLCAYSDSPHACLEQDSHPQNTLFSRAASIEMEQLLLQYNTPHAHAAFKSQIPSLDR